eukprot:357733-Pelagomonas_calceolata.AAC.3
MGCKPHSRTHLQETAESCPVKQSVDSIKVRVAVYVWTVCMFAYSCAKSKADGEAVSIQKNMLACLH